MKSFKISNNTIHYNVIIMSIFRNGMTICLVERNEAESIDKFIIRGNFVASQKPQNDQEYIKAVLYSNIYVNVKFLKCVYGVNIMKELKLMEEKL